MIPKIFNPNSALGPISFCKFPKPFLGDPYGIRALGGSLSPSLLISAYLQGCFPWPMEGLEIPWCSPSFRGILFFDEIKFKPRLFRYLQKLNLHFTINRSFHEVVLNCKNSVRKDKGTWITNEILEAYSHLNTLGIAHSFECWQGDQLVAGMYGVGFNNYFAGESMFFKLSNTSKFVLLWACLCILKNRGLSWIDTQMTTPHLASLGGREIAHSAFITLLQNTLNFDPEMNSDFILQPLWDSNIKNSSWLATDLYSLYLSQK